MADKEPTVREYKTNRSVSFFTSDLEWFDSEYPDFSLSALTTMLLRNFRRIHDDTGVTPVKCAKDAGRELKEQIDEGLLK